MFIVAYQNFRKAYFNQYINTILLKQELVSSCFQHLATFY